jgi:SOS-response transcriptional repressor LexA
MKTIQMPNEILLTSAAAFLDEGREVVLRAKGNSMLPFIRNERDSVVLRKSDSLEVGDIVLVQLPGKFVMHRIIKRDGDNFRMMGDGNCRGTERFRREDVLGKVIWIVKEDGRRVAPGKARVWKALLPVRRLLLVVYRIFWK